MKLAMKLHDQAKTLGLLLFLVILNSLSFGATMHGGEPSAKSDLWVSFLIAYVFWFHIAAGGLAFLMIQYLTGGAWGVMGRRVFEATSSTLPVFAILLVAMVTFGVPNLYEWARPEAAHDVILQKKSAYLNVPAFTIRGVIYFVVWIALSFLLVKLGASTSGAESEGPHSRKKCAVLSGPGMVLYGLTMTFASIDWVMSLEPHWYSSLYGALFVAGQLLSALAFTIVVLAVLSRKQDIAKFLGKRHFHDYGKLLLAFVMLWAYLSFSQYLIIWSGNLAEEVPYYLKRLQGGWEKLAITLIIAHFALPFLILLSRDLKRQPFLLLLVAVFILFMRFCEVLFLVRPAVTTSLSLSALLSDLLAVAIMGVCWIFIFLFIFQKRSPLPFEDPTFAEAVAHGRH